MNDQEPQIYQQLRQIVEDATHFREALRLLGEKYGIRIMTITSNSDWGGVTDSRKGILGRFQTFSQAFEFGLGLLEVKA